MPELPDAFGPAQGAFIGGVVLGLLGAVAGLIQGLRVHPATAWFAVFEVGVPAFLSGALVGAAVGMGARLVDHLRRSDGGRN